MKQKTDPYANTMWKNADEYHRFVREHLRCEGGPFFGAQLWAHVKVDFKKKRN